MKIIHPSISTGHKNNLKACNLHTENVTLVTNSLNLNKLAVVTFTFFCHFDTRMAKYRNNKRNVILGFVGNFIEDSAPVKSFAEMYNANMLF